MSNPFITGLVVGGLEEQATQKSIQASASIGNMVSTFEREKAQKANEQRLADLEREKKNALAALEREKKNELDNAGIDSYQKQVEIENYYKDLLSKPMAEIAAQHGGFKAAYEKQQEMLASWIVSQRAFKEIAMKYGKMVGKTPEEVIEEVKDVKPEVVEKLSEQDPLIKRYGKKVI